MESATEQMTDDPKYGGEFGEEKSESEGKESEHDEEAVNKEVDLQEAKSESSGDPEGKETEVDNDNSESEGKQENNKMETEAEDDADTSDNETLVIYTLVSILQAA